MFENVAPILIDNYFILVKSQKVITYLILIQKYCMCECMDLFVCLFVVACKSLINPLIPLSIVITRPWGVNNFAFVVCESVFYFCWCCCFCCCCFFEISQRILIYILALYGELMLFNEQTNNQTTTVAREWMLQPTASANLTLSLLRSVLESVIQTVSHTDSEQTKLRTNQPTNLPTKQAVKSPTILLTTSCNADVACCCCCSSCRCWMLLLLWFLVEFSFSLFSFVLLCFISRLNNFSQHFRVYDDGTDSGKGTEQPSPWMCVAVTTTTTAT